MIERKITNRTSSEHSRRGYYTIVEYDYPSRPSQILECSIENEQRKNELFSVKDHGHWLEANTKDQLKIPPGDAAKLCGKAQQYRRINDSIWETFIDPIVDPRIEVKIDESCFGHQIEFGTKGDVVKAKYANTYTLRGVYFTGQFMNVLWRPKKGGSELRETPAENTDSF